MLSQTVLKPISKCHAFSKSLRSLCTHTTSNSEFQNLNQKFPISSISNMTKEELEMRMSSTEKELRRKRDHLLKGFTEKMRISIIQNTRSVSEAKRRHKLSPASTKLIGKMMSATSILAGWQKGEERVVLTLNSHSGAGTVTTEAIQTGEIRGYTTNPKYDPSQNDPSMSPGGTLSVRKILYNHARPYDSVTPIALGDVSSDIMQYYQLSEQIPAYAKFETLLNFHGEVVFSGGLIMEAMPPNNEERSRGETNKEYLIPYIQRLNEMPPISHLFEEQSLNLKQIMDLIAPEINHSDTERAAIDFFCRCSKDKFKANLKTLGTEGLKHFFQLAGPERFLSCHFCATDYFLDENDMNELHEELVYQRKNELKNHLQQEESSKMVKDEMEKH